MWGTVTVVTPDMYGGAAVTTKNLYRETGASTFTEVAGAATFSANPHQEYEVIFGIGATDDDDEPFGCKAVWTAPCLPTPRLDASKLCKWTDASGQVRSGVIDDTAAGTSLTSTLFDPDDGDAITATATIDLDAADIKSVRWVLSGVFEEAYGNPWVDENVVTLKYNSTCYDSVKLTNSAGIEYQTTTTPNHYTATAGHVTKSYKFPATVTTTEITSIIVVDVDDTENPNATAAANNITVYVYDGNWFQNNDMTPPEIQGGVQDEDAAQVGGSTDFSDQIHCAEE